MTPEAIERMPMRDWLNAGHRMLTMNVDDPLTLTVFDRLFGADSEAEMESAFSELTALGDSLMADFRKAEREARRKRSISASVGDGELEAAAAEWGMVMPSKPDDAGGDE